ncbi:MAG TPA: hypothetical protein VGO62_11330, partial [Myxococcota bacterium]
SQEQPSIVISMDLEPGEPTVVGANIPMATGGKHVDPTRTVEVSPVSLQDKGKTGGFDGGGVHESLIIDFDGGEAEAQQQQKDTGGEGEKAIRPAAQPLGRRVQSQVASPTPKRPAPRGPAADESPGNTMPPPTRRRS